MLSAQTAGILVAGGLLAGFINTLAGGGSFLTVPLLILAGVPPSAANGTNRVAVLIQSLAAARGFTQEGVPGVRLALSLVPATLLGAWLGAWGATHVSDEVFRRLFAVIMLLALPIVLRNPLPGAGGPHRALPLPVQLALYFAIGLYGGAIQAGHEIDSGHQLARRCTVFDTTCTRGIPGLDNNATGARNCVLAQWRGFGDRLGQRRCGRLQYQQRT